MGFTAKHGSSVKSSDPLGSGDHNVYLNGVDLHYYVRGNGPLLFLMPLVWGVGSGYLQRGFKFLAARFQLVFLDTRGSGLSGRPVDRTKMSSNDMADDLEALRQFPGLSTIRAPVLIMAGKHDCIRPVFIAEGLHADIRNSYLVTFEITSANRPWLQNGIF